MSYDWDLYCVDCQVEAGESLNRGDKQLRQIVQAWPILSALRTTAGYGYAYDLTSMWHISPWEWLDAHGTHKVCLLGEDGAMEPIDATALEIGCTIRLRVTAEERSAIGWALNLPALPTAREVHEWAELVIKGNLTGLATNRQREQEGKPLL